MEKHIFYRKFSNMPLPKREIGILMGIGKEIKTPCQIYREIKNYDEIIAKAEARQKELLEEADLIIN